MRRMKVNSYGERMPACSQPTAFFATLAAVNIKLLPEFALASTVMSLSGLMICVAWYLTLERQFAQHGYWFAWIRHIEKKSLFPEIQIVSAGKTYSEGGTFDFGTEGPNILRFGWAARSFKVKWMMVAEIAVFAALYVFPLRASIAR